MQNTLTALEKKIVEAAIANQSFSFFNRVPKDILINHLLPLHATEDWKTMSSLAVTATSGTLFHTYQIETINPLVKALLHAVVHAQYDEVKKILDNTAKNSLYLLEIILSKPMEIIDSSGRHLFGNALQLAFGAGDMSRDEYPNEGIADLLMTFYDKLNEGKSLKQKHIYEFLKYAEITPEQNAKDLNMVEKVFQEIADAKGEDSCEESLQTFKKYVKPDPKKLIKGKHLNLNILIKAYELYDKNFSNFGGTSSHKNMLIKSNVIDCLRHLLPDCDAQIFRQGIWEVVDRMPFNRSIGYDKGDRLLSSLPLRQGFAILCPRRIHMSDGRVASCFVSMARCISDLMRIKHERMKSYTESSANLSLRP